MDECISLLVFVLHRLFLDEFDQRIVISDFSLQRKCSSTLTQEKMLLFESLFHFFSWYNIPGNSSDLQKSKEKSISSGVARFLRQCSRHYHLLCLNLIPCHFQAMIGKKSSLLGSLRNLPFRNGMFRWSSVYWEKPSESKKSVVVRLFSTIKLAVQLLHPSPYRNNAIRC